MLWLLSSLWVESACPGCCHSRGICHAGSSTGAMVPRAFCFCCWRWPTSVVGQRLRGYALRQAGQLKLFGSAACC